MKPHFIRVLWGDDTYKVRKGIVADLDRCIKHPVKIHTQWYCYGENNRDLLRERGVEPVMLDPFPYLTHGQKEANPEQHGVVMYGASIWFQKYPPIQHALVTQGGDSAAIIYLDLDTLPTREIPDDFWVERAKGAEFQCCLRLGTRKRAWWRGPVDCRKTPCGSLMYFRGQNAICSMLRLYQQHIREWDLHVLAMLGDELQGGWRGIEAWQAEGYEPDFHWFPRGQHVFPRKPDPLFISSQKRGLRALGLR